MKIRELIETLSQYGWDLKVGMADMDEYGDAQISKIDGVRTVWLSEAGVVYDYAANVPPDVKATEMVVIE